MHLNWEKFKKNINDSKKVGKRACIHVYYQNIQTCSSLKPLGQLKPYFYVKYP